MPSRMEFGLFMKKRLFVESFITRFNFFGRLLVNCLLFFNYAVHAFLF